MGRLGPFLFLVRASESTPTIKTSPKDLALSHPCLPWKPKEKTLIKR
jgi:hypothetical protein